MRKISDYGIATVQETKLMILLHTCKSPTKLISAVAKIMEGNADLISKGFIDAKIIEAAEKQKGSF